MLHICLFIFFLEFPHNNVTDHNAFPFCVGTEPIFHQNFINFFTNWYDTFIVPYPPFFVKRRTAEKDPQF